MAWEVALFKRTRLAVHRNCLELMEANALFAPWWERLCLATFVGAGPVVASWFGADTRASWLRAEEILADLFAVTRLPAREIASLLRRYVELKLMSADHLPFESARAEIYEQDFYPVVTHVTFALQPSALARLKFVRDVVSHMPSRRACVADLGCGAGVMLCEVLKMRPVWRGYGLDISPAAINYAQSLAHYKGVAERINLRAGDAAQLPYADKSLDLVICSEVIEHSPQPERVLREIARVLRPRGQLILTAPLESHTPAHIHTLSDEEDFRRLCEDAGLHIRRLKRSWQLGFGDDRRHIFVQAEKPVRSEVRKKPERETVPACAEVAFSH